MEFKETLTIISTLIGIVVGLITISEKISKIKIDIWEIFPQDTRFAMELWTIGTIFPCLIGSVIYINQYSDGASTDVIRFLLRLAPWVTMIIIAYSQRERLSGASLWKYIMFTSIGSVIISYIISTYTLYFAITVMIILVIYGGGLLLGGS